MACIHTWGWTIALNPDDTTTMTSPDGDRIYHSHSPPTPHRRHHDASASAASIFVPVVACP